MSDACCDYAEVLLLCMHKLVVIQICHHHACRNGMIKVDADFNVVHDDSIPACIVSFISEKCMSTTYLHNNNISA